MKRIFVSLIVVSGLLCLSLFSCHHSDLQESIFINDPDNPGLPKYSEWGYNTFGVYYDRNIFVSDYYQVPIKVVITGDSTSFIFHGRTNGVYNDLRLTISTHDMLPEKYDDLVALNQTTLDLTDPGYTVNLSRDNIQHEVKVLNGMLEFKRTQLLLVDKQQVETILSGMFEMQVLVDNVPVSFTHGRFDVGVGENNFFKY
jgi:hypothetical protein